MYTRNQAEGTIKVLKDLLSNQVVIMSTAIGDCYFEAIPNQMITDIDLTCYNVNSYGLNLRHCNTNGTYEYIVNPIGRISIDYFSKTVQAQSLNGDNEQIRRLITIQTCNRDERGEMFRSFRDARNKLMEIGVIGVI